jgi:putative NADH-flavin reductase
MDVVLYGATGKSGGEILKELLRRGHTVTAVVRDPAKLASQPGLTVVKGDLNGPASEIRKINEGKAAVICAYAPPVNDTDQLLPVVHKLLETTGENTRLIVVGGAASLEVASGVTLLESGHLPEMWVPIATSHKKALEILKNSKADWTYFSPAAFFEPGPRTGKFRLGKDQLITDEQGNSRISMADYAVALVDELEQGKHHHERFTIGY